MGSDLRGYPSVPLVCQRKRFRSVLLDSKQRKSKKKSSNSQNLSQPLRKSGNFPIITFYGIFINKYISIMCVELNTGEIC